MEKDKISIIIPVYNTADCLGRCVSSLTGQTYRNLEILLIDDGSVDGSGLLCDKFAKEDERIRVFHKDNGGASSARNLGLRMAQGEYIGFVDSDDYMDEDAYQEMIELSHKGGYEIVQISRDERDEKLNRLPDICEPPEKIRFCDAETFMKELLLHKADCSFCTKLIHREVLKGHSFPEGELNEDFKLLVELLQEIKGVAILPKQGYHVVCRMDSTTRSRSVDSFSRVFTDIVENADAIERLVEKRYPNLTLYAVRFGLYQRLEYMLHVPVSRMSGKDHFYVQVKSYLRRHMADTVRNPYLTVKNKVYLLLLTIAPRSVRSVHAWMMRRRVKRKGYYYG